MLIIKPIASNLAKNIRYLIKDLQPKLQIKHRQCLLIQVVTFLLENDMQQNVRPLLGLVVPEKGPENGRFPEIFGILCNKGKREYVSNVPLNIYSN